MSFVCLLSWANGGKRGWDESLQGQIFFFSVIFLRGNLPFGGSVPSKVAPKGLISYVSLSIAALRHNLSFQVDCKLFVISLHGVQATFVLLLYSHGVVSDSLQPHGLQHTRLLCPSLTLGVCSGSCPRSWWCQLTISFPERWIPERFPLLLLPSVFPSINVFSSELAPWIR